MCDFAVVLTGLRLLAQLRITDKLGSHQKVKQLGYPKHKILGGSLLVKQKKVKVRNSTSRLLFSVVCCSSRIR